MNITGKVIELEQYRKRGQQKKREAQTAESSPPAPDRAIKEMAYYMMMALQCARRLL